MPLAATPPASFGLPTARPIGGSSPHVIQQVASLPIAAAGNHPLPLDGGIPPQRLAASAGVLPPTPSSSHHCCTVPAAVGHPPSAVGHPIAVAAAEPLPAHPVAASPETPPPEADDDAKDRDRRHRATVSRVGVSPALIIHGVGEFPFAYRAVKKKPGEPRTLLAVGDVVECRLTKSAPPKAVSVRILQGTNIPLTKASPEALTGAEGLPVARSLEPAESVQGLTPTCSEKTMTVSPTGSGGEKAAAHTAPARVPLPLAPRGVAEWGAPRRASPARPPQDCIRQDDAPPALCDDECPVLLDDDADCIPLCGATAGDASPALRGVCGRGGGADMSSWVESLLDPKPAC